MRFSHKHRIYGLARFYVFPLLFLLLLSLASTAQNAKLSPLTPPLDAPRLIPGPGGQVLISLQLDNPSTNTNIHIKNYPFWNTSGESIELPLIGPGAAADGKSAELKFGQPIRLQAEQIPNGQILWSVFEIEQGGTSHLLPVVIGHFGPTVQNSNAINATAEGRIQITVDMSHHQGFGESATFALTQFSSGGHAPSLHILDPSDGRRTDSVDIAFNRQQSTISLEIDAGELHPEIKYNGSLLTRIGSQEFIATPLVFTRQHWSAGASFKTIQPSVGKGTDPIALTVQAASGPTIRGLSVSSKTAAQENFDPRNDLKVTLGGKSLWTFDARDTEEVASRSLTPNTVKEIMVHPTRKLIAGRYEATLLVGALNVDPDKWVEAKVTFIVRNPWFWAVGILVFAVLFSYMTTKGVVTLVRRSRLSAKITAIRQQSWLSEDRWGALPIVRAFGRVARADRALKSKYFLNPFKMLSRLVTTPQLIEDEVEEVSQRLAVFEQLNKLALYWKVAPSNEGVVVKDMDSKIIRRAQKKLRGIVDQLSQLKKGEEISPDLLAKIDELKSWQTNGVPRDQYWDDLRADIQRLLDQVQVEQYDFDSSKLVNLKDLLLTMSQTLASTPSDKALVDDLRNALHDSEVAEQKGVQAIAGHLQPIIALSDDQNRPPDIRTNANQISTILNTLFKCEQETVRRLEQSLSDSTLPARMKEILRVEDNYIRLKLVWEQRNDSGRRKKLINNINSKVPLDKFLKAFDDDVWELLKQSNTIRIVPPERTVEEYASTDFKVECTKPEADTFLFKHDLEYEWTIDWGGTLPLKPITRSTMVTQFIPKMNATVKVAVRFRRDDTWRDVEGENGEKREIQFKTVATSRYKDLWPTGAPELIGVALALVLALLAGFQSDAFNNALEGSWKDLLTLFAWGIGAEQAKTLIKNLDTFFKA